MEHPTRQSTLFCLCILLIVLWSEELSHIGRHSEQPDGLRVAGTARLSASSNLWRFYRIIENMQAEPTQEIEHAESDAGLVHAARKGERPAFAGLYQRHAGWLRPLLWRLAGGDDGLAEDLLQESFVQAWQKLDQLREPERFGGWLRQLAVNLALADRRRVKVTGSDDALPQLADIEPPWPSADLDLERAIAQLPARAREVLVLFCIEGLSHGEIATMLHVEVGTSKAQLHRARQLLKETLS